MSENILQQKSFDFAVRIVNLFKYLGTQKKEFIISKQLLRSGTSVGALVREAKHAESRNDFVHKLGIAQKEMNETIYWIQLLNAGNFISTREFLSIQSDANELMSILTAILKTIKNKDQNQKE